MLKGTKLYSIITGTCPVCQNESMYTSSNLYNPSKTQEMNERCSHCGTKYKIEPSFFYGSMYVSYGVGIAIAMAAFVICYFLLNLSRWNIFLVITSISVLSLPIVIRVSRNIWINIFMDYDKEKAKKN
ncbi:DUF983 domain-containing protein [Nonlabens arenilitoris]|uniref:DUF983 domain-containing protein n=2 Tax=Nonlabens arenilitoris TaxID=1217969 RepID=A0A2S7U7P1_9FLAO|nr:MULTISPECIES: DUF983 domain-containing protein [Nonlabens]PQJ30985.1 DUF983 domain-containing protein [Nonlabens arenilitoris]GAK90013.1 hypothetical protein JCM19297_635 [Nonlabens ulvanivorans]